VTAHSESPCTHAELAVLTERLRALDERLKGERATDRDALHLQAAEYERRLEMLNHEASRLQQSVAQNVSADTWTAFAKEHEDMKRRYDDQINLNSNRLTRLETRSIVYGGLLAAIPSALAIAALFLR
jgi:chromosome segregation ATPase